MSTRDVAADPLTDAESLVLRMVESGYSNGEIATRLSIAVGTVKCHLHRIYEKLEVRNRLEAVAWANVRKDIASDVASPARRIERNFR